MDSFDQPFGQNDKRHFDIVCLLYRMIYYILVVHFHAKQCQCGESDICTNFCDLIVKSFILLLYFF